MTAKLVTTATDNKTSSRGGAKTNSSFDIKACWKSWEEWVLKWFQINTTQMLKNLVEVWRVSKERILLSGGSLHRQTTHNHYSLSTASTHLSTLSAVSHTHDWTLFIFQPFSLHLDTDPPLGITAHRRAAVCSLYLCVMPYPGETTLISLISTCTAA